MGVLSRKVCSAAQVCPANVRLVGLPMVWRGKLQMVPTRSFARMTSDLLTPIPLHLRASHSLDHA